MRRISQLPVDAVLSLACAALLAACPQAEPKPVTIVLSEDSCSVCRMAVSDKTFAAEAVTPSGHVDYFDDIGCLVEFVRTQPPPRGTALFTVDFYSQQWLEAKAASYLWARETGRELPTPMSYGLAAFGTPLSAERAALRWPGRVLGWEELLKEWQP